ncbi:MAG: hypothetical protein ABR975_05855 [Vulcanimicrobiaceae bacterium]|jgi:hypothetical protein
MGIFDKKDDRAQRREQQGDSQRAADDAKLREHGLLLDESDDALLRTMNAKSLRRILGERGWSNYWSVGTFNADAADKVQINLLKMLTEQHFVMIRQNEQIIRLLQGQDSHEAE